MPDSPAYAHLANALIPTDGDWATADGQLHDYLTTHGDRAFRRAVAGGQYSYPQGLFYGGTQASFSRLLIERKLAEWQLDQRQVVALDLHTAGAFRTWRTDLRPPRQQHREPQGTSLVRRTRYLTGNG